jgi:hypothetical protein
VTRRKARIDRLAKSAGYHDRSFRPVART